MASAGDSAGPLRYFSGDSEDAQEYRRWRTWVRNKILTLDKLPKTASGPYIYTLLTGKALECVEHLEPSSYQKEGGDAVLLDLLDKRFPDKDKTDELGEMLTEVFSLKAQANETVKGWIGRASELFDRLNRKTQVNLPEEARGWLLLNRCGLTDEQKAVVLARAHGDLKRDEIGRALRSCYPDMILGSRRTAAAHLVEGDDDTSTGVDNEPEIEFQDIEQFLAEHGHSAEAFPSTTDDNFHEDDVAECLAVTWKEKRAEINRLQKARKFQQVKELKRQFRVEVEEIKRKSRCHKCQRQGHWARECPFKGNSSGGAATSGAKGSGKSASTGAACAQSVSEPEVHFVAAVAKSESLLDRLRQLTIARRSTIAAKEPSSEQQHETFLVSSPGFGVLDSGCGKTIVGEETLAQFQQLWKAQGVKMPTIEREVNHFKYGNGHHEVSQTCVKMPVFVGGRHGMIKAAIVQGSAPLLISRPALRSLQAKIDFANDQLVVFQDQLKIPLTTNAAGQYVLNVMRADQSEISPDEILMSSSSAENDELPDQAATDVADEQVLPDVHPIEEEVELINPGDSATPHRVVIQSREDFGLTKTPVSLTVHDAKFWPFVFKRVTVDKDTNKVLFVDSVDPKKPRKLLLRDIPKDVNHVVTKFHLRIPEDLECPPELTEQHAWNLSSRQMRQLSSQIKAAAAVQSMEHERPLVVEVFSPPRFAPTAKSRGFHTRSIDIKLGTDLSCPKNRSQLKAELKESPPDLLVLCPPCTNESGWIHLNAPRRERLEFLRRKAQSRIFIRFCCDLFRQQVALGGRAVFEHPAPSQMWQYPEVQSLCRRYFVTKLHMCCYGMSVPDSTKYIKKATKLLLTHEDMMSLGKECPGPSDPAHVEHDVIAGTHPKVGAVSAYAGQYPAKFVQAVLQLVPRFRDQEVLMLECDDVTVEQWHEISEVCAVTREQPTEAEVLQTLTKLHKNLGHPPNADLIRLLRHGQASDLAISLAKNFTCSFCQSREKPKTPLPANTDRVCEFNKQIGIDVKHLHGWRSNQKVKSLNIVDQASGFQRVIPFFETETSKLLRRLLDEHWISWAGIPGEIILDPAQTNLADPMTGTAEEQGCVVRQIAADAHWQLGKTENHGGWFDRILQKVIDQHSPSSQAEWLECVTAAHVKNSMIHVHGHTPHQFVFGRNPNVPSNLLDEPQHVVPATVSLTDAAIAKAQQIRATARHAVLDLQDDRSIRRALSARPRVSRDFKAGDLVSYWRSQKWIKGELQNEGRWYGTAIVLGNVGRNLVLAHRKQILRCAPEQVRLATSEERTLVGTPQAELLGIKDLIEGGAFKSQQYVDLVPQAYPTEQVPSVSPPEQAPADATTASPAASSIPAETPNDVPSAIDKSPETKPLSDVSMEGQPSLSQAVVPTVEPPPFSTTAESTVLPSNSSSETAVDSSSSTYGPVRRRVSGKDGPQSLWRPAALRQEDFADVMKEIVPKLIAEMTDAGDTHIPESSKRAHDDAAMPDDACPEPPATRARVESASEVLSVECLNSKQLDVEVLIADYLKKKMQKELPHSNNDIALQSKVDAGKREEWQTLLSKDNVLRIHYGKKAREIKEKFAHRFIGSRFVLTRKALNDETPVNPNDYSTFTVKGRWCLQGHLDPDLDVKVEEGRLRSPTLSQMGRMALLQLLSSYGWKMQLGDIKGAFLEAGPLEDRFRPLYASHPPGGIPGLDSSAVIEVVGNLYGQNDAPAAWFQTFDRELRALNWTPSAFDPCLYQLRDESNCLIGLLGCHVDDCLLGGMGPQFTASVDALRKRFPFRKWRVGAGEFCGAYYQQDEDGTIHMSMRTFAQNLRPANVPKDASPEKCLEPHQIKVLRAINGSLNWLSSQARPDLAAQTSLSQQSFPNPKVKHLKQASNIVRRAKQHCDLSLTFAPIPVESLTVACHSDAAFANVGNHTQAGFILGFVHESLNNGQMVQWNPAVWRSFRLSRAVSSTLAAESQAMSIASGTVEWMMLILAELIDGPFSVRQAADVLKRRSPILVTDCKSLYDHLASPSSPTAVEDRRTSIDITIIQESIRNGGMHVRWVPTDRMLADSLTKDAGDPVDLLRSCMRSFSYQISPESQVLDRQALEKQLRLGKKPKLSDA